jgi:hypothetical protein
MLAHAQWLCPHCRVYRVCERPAPNHVFHLLMTLVTLGIWLVVWLWIGINAEFRPWVCSSCRGEVEEPARNVPPLTAAVIICAWAILCFSIAMILIRR